LYLKKYCLY